MRYELYGVLSNRGHNVLISTNRSLKKAVESLQDLNENIYPLFAILAKQRAGSAPISCESGRTKDRQANRSTSFLTGVNPTQQQYGKDFWARTKPNKS